MFRGERNHYMTFPPFKKLLAHALLGTSVGYTIVVLCALEPRNLSPAASPMPATLGPNNRAPPKHLGASILTKGLAVRILKPF